MLKRSSRPSGNEVAAPGWSLTRARPTPPSAPLGPPPSPTRDDVVVVCERLPDAYMSGSRGGTRIPADGARHEAASQSDFVGGGVDADGGSIPPVSSSTSNGERPPSGERAPADRSVGSRRLHSGTLETRVPGVLPLGTSVTAPSSGLLRRQAKGRWWWRRSTSTWRCLGEGMAKGAGVGESMPAQRRSTSSWAFCRRRPRRGGRARGRAARSRGGQPRGLGIDDVEDLAMSGSVESVGHLIAVPPEVPCQNAARVLFVRRGE